MLNSVQLLETGDTYRALVPRRIVIIMLLVALAGMEVGNPEPVAADLSADTLLDRVVARLGELSPHYETRGVLAISVVRLDRPEWASFRGSEQYKSASVVKAVWVAAALDTVGIEPVAPLAPTTLVNSSNESAGRVIDRAGGIDVVNDWAHTLGMEQTTAYEWEFAGVERRSAAYPGPLRGNNVTTTDDLAGFWAAVAYGYALGSDEAAAFREWTRGPRASTEGNRLIARLPAAVGELTSLKGGWLQIGREYTLDDGETGWGGEPSGTVVTFVRGAVSTAAGIVTTPNGVAYAIAIAAYDGNSWVRMTSWVEYTSCIVYSVTAHDPIDCVRNGDPPAVRQRVAEPAGSIEQVTVGAASIVVEGWAADPDAWWNPTRVLVTFDGVGVGMASAVPTGQNDLFAPRFRREIPYEGGTHEICVVALNDGAGEDTPIGCVMVSIDGS